MTGRKSENNRRRNLEKAPIAESRGRGRQLADRAIADADPELAKEIEDLSPEEAAIFLQLIEAALKKRRILLAGYALALLFMLGGMLGALYIYAHRDPGQFLGWIFLVPFALVGATLTLFGRWSRRR